MATILTPAFSFLQFDKALQYYDKTIRVQCNHVEAHCNKGVILKNEGHLEEAIAAYNSALAAAPDFQIVNQNLAIALTEKATKIKTEGRLEESKPLTCLSKLYRTDGCRRCASIGHFSVESPSRTLPSKGILFSEY